MIHRITLRMKLLTPLLLCFILVYCQRETPAPPSFRIVSLAPNWTHTVSEIGAKEQLVGVTRFCIFPADIQDLVASGKLVSIGGFVDLSMGRVDSLKPDLVLTATGMQLRYHDFLNEHQIPFIHMEETSLAETYEKIIALGDFIERGPQALALVERIKAELVDLQSQYGDLPKVDVYYEINYAYKCVPGADSYIRELMQMVGANPIFSEREGIAPYVTWDEVLSARPEVILLPWWESAWNEGPHFKGPQRGYGTTTIAEVARREDARDIPAVQTGKIRYINSAKTKQAGPMIPVAVKLFAEAVHAPGNPDRLGMDFVPREIAMQDSFKTGMTQE